MTSSTEKRKPVFVLVPGASQNPAHYAYLLHLLQSAGYGATTGFLPSVGAQGGVTAADDAEYICKHLILPILNIGNQDVILISHSYSGMPASAAARGLGPADRAAEGKITSVVGQIFIATILPRGELSVIDSFGGHLPPHMYIDVCILPLPFPSCERRPESYLCASGNFTSLIMVTNSKSTIFSSAMIPSLPSSTM